MGYLDNNCWPAPCETRQTIVPGVSRTLFVLNEAILLGLQLGQEVSLGDDIVIIQITSQTLPYGVVKYTNEFGLGWEAFTILGNGSAQGGTLNVVTPPANFTDFSMFPGDTPPAAGAWFAFTPNQIWTYKGGDTQWRYADRISG